MIRGENIPLTSEEFVKHCTDDVLNGRYAKSPDAYLKFLEEETEKRDKLYMDYLRIVDRQSGHRRFSADADHIIPQSVWGILMFGFLEPGKCGTSFNVLSNLFWRDPEFNRKEDALAIRLVKSEAPSVRLSSRKGFAWRKKWIEIFIGTKRPEGKAFPGYSVDPAILDRLPAADEQSNFMNRG